MAPLRLPPLVGGADEAHRAHPHEPLGTAAGLLVGDAEIEGNSQLPGTPDRSRVDDLEQLLPSPANDVEKPAPPADATGDSPGTPHVQQNSPPKTTARLWSKAKIVKHAIAFNIDDWVHVPLRRWWQAEGWLVALFAKQWPMAREGVDFQISDNRARALAVLAVQGACATFVIVVGHWFVTLVYIILVICWSLLLVRQLLIEGYQAEVDKGAMDEEAWVIVFKWCWSVWMVFPAVLFASTTQGSFFVGWTGLIILVGALWTLGWACLWYLGEGMKPIGRDQHLLGVPPYLLLRLKLITVVGECFHYSALAFVPAIPWQAMDVPAPVPNPQPLLLASFFDFTSRGREAESGDSGGAFGGFMIACLTVVGSFAWMWLAHRRRGGRLFGGGGGEQGEELLVVQVCFDLLAFPVLRQLTAVFSCGATCTDLASGFIAEQKCMALDPSIVCWADMSHRAYIALALVLLVPYFAGTLLLQAAAQARDSGALSPHYHIATCADGSTHSPVACVTIKLCVCTQNILLRSRPH